jgi:plastocyanin
MKHLTLTIILALLLFAPAARAATVQVTVRNFEFDPEVVDIQAGDTVVWTNVSGIHSVVSDDGTSFTSGEGKNAPWTFSHTFTAPGTVPYHCGVHLFMTGTVNVTGTAEECVPSSTTLCLNDSRFEVSLVWNDLGVQRQATAVPLDLSPDSGLFYFSNVGNIEMLVKVLDACVDVLGNKYWVFYAATTNIEFTLTVHDTLRGATKTYHNPPNTAAVPVQDTSAFATCP